MTLALPPTLEFILQCAVFVGLICATFGLGRVLCWLEDRSDKRRAAEYLARIRRREQEWPIKYPEDRRLPTDYEPAKIA